MKFSLHFGLNNVSPAAYGGWDGQLFGCINDAHAWKKLAQSRDFDQTGLFLDGDATLAALKGELRSLAAEAAPGDTVLITYSGHGAQLANPQEADGKDETLCLFDGEIRDDEFRALLALFSAGVSVGVMLDCCHSGGMDRVMRGHRGRYMPHRVAEHLALAYARNTRTTVSPRPIHALPATVTAGVIMFTACREHEVASDGTDMGAFTQSAMQAWRGCWLRPSWQKWFGRIEGQCRRINPAQHPNAHRLGADRWEAKAL